MSLFTCICADRPLQEYPEHFASISEQLQKIALPAGISFIPAPSTTQDAGIWEDTIPCDAYNLCIFCVDVRGLEIATSKQYCVIVQWDDKDVDCAERLIRYMQSQMQNNSELELWHFWADGDYSHRTKTIEIPITQITPGKLEQIENLPVWDPVVNYCYRLTLPGSAPV